MTVPSWLSWSLRYILYSSLCSCHLFLISSASVRSLPCFVLCYAHPCIKSSLDTSNFFEAISSLFQSIVFLYFFCMVHLRRLSYLSLLFSETPPSEGYLFPFLPSLLILFFPQLFLKPPETTTLPSYNCLFVGDDFGHYLLHSVRKLYP